MSTVGGMSPLQQYTAGSVGSTLFTGDAAVDVETFGLDPDGPIPESDDDTVMISVPDTNIPLSQSSFDTLHTTIDPLQDCDDFGVDLYVRTVRLMYQLMQNDDLL